MHSLTQDLQINSPKKIDSTNHSIWMKRLERITITAGIIGPLTVIPQIFVIYSTRNVAGVSALSWFAFGMLDIPFLLYGLIRKDKPIIFTYALWLIANFIVACGALIYS